MMDDQTFGARLRQARKAAGLTGVGAAAILHTSESNVRRYEAGETLPNVYRAIDMAALYGVSVGWLCGMKDGKHLTQAAPTFVERLRQARKAANMSVTLAGEMLYTCASLITLYETGRRCPGIGRVVEMAELYGVSLDWLCGMDGGKTDEG